jgi:hypothetical protein
MQERQRKQQDRTPTPDARIDEMLAKLYDKEMQTAKPWRQPGGGSGRRRLLPPMAGGRSASFSSNCSTFRALIG